MIEKLMEFLFVVLAIAGIVFVAIVSAVVALAPVGLIVVIIWAVYVLVSHFIGATP